MSDLLDWAKGQDVGSALYWTCIGLGVVLVPVFVFVIRRLLRQIRSGTQAERDTRLLTLIFLMALGINADAMLRVATQKLNLAWWFACLVFAFFEVLQLHFMRVGRRNYEDHRKTGNAAGIVWSVALLSSVVTLMNSHNPVEAALRVVLPVTVAGVWYLNLVTDLGKPSAGRFRYTPHRIMVTLGLLEPDSDIDYDRISRSRKVRKVVTLSYKVSRGGRLREWRVNRLRKLIEHEAHEVLVLAATQRRSARGAFRLLTNEEEDGSELDGDTADELFDQFVLDGDDHQCDQCSTAVETSTPTSTETSTTSAVPSTGTSTADQFDQFVLDDQCSTATSDPVQRTGSASELDAVLIEAVLLERREKNMTGDQWPSVNRVREICTPPGEEKRCGPDRARRILKLAKEQVAQKAE